MKSHLKRIAIPRTWKLERKNIKFIARPLPGKHSLVLGMPIKVILRDVLGYAKNSKEANHILNNKEVLVDMKTVKEPKYIVGFMDSIAFPKLDKYFRVIINEQGNLCLLEIKKDDAQIKLCKITGKKKLKKNMTQLNLSDGRNIIAEDKYNVGDSLLIELPSQKIKESVKLEKNTLVMLTHGKHIGKIETLEEIKGAKIFLRKEDKSKFETLKKYAFAVGKERPIIKVRK